MPKKTLTPELKAILVQEAMKESAELPNKKHTCSSCGKKGTVKDVFKAFNTYDATLGIYRTKPNSWCMDCRNLRRKEAKRAKAPKQFSRAMVQALTDPKLTALRLEYDALFNKVLAEVPAE